MRKIRILLLDDDTQLGQVDLHEDHEIANLITGKPYRRQGIAEQLVRLAEVVAQELGYPRVFATTALSNEASQGLWEKHRYKQWYKYEKRF